MASYLLSLNLRDGSSRQLPVLGLAVLIGQRPSPTSWSSTFRVTAPGSRSVDCPLAGLHATGLLSRSQTPEVLRRVRRRGRQSARARSPGILSGGDCPQLKPAWKCVTIEGVGTASCQQDGRPPLHRASAELVGLRVICPGASVERVLKNWAKSRYYMLM